MTSSGNHEIDSFPFDYRILNAYLDSLDMVLDDCKNAADTYRKFRLGSKGLSQQYKQGMAFGERVFAQIISSLKNFRIWATDYVALERNSITPSEIASLKSSWTKNFDLLEEVIITKLRAMPKNLHWEQELYRFELSTQTYYVSFIQDVLNNDAWKEIAANG